MPGRIASEVTEGLGGSPVLLGGRARVCMRPVSLQSPRGILEFPDQDFGGPPDGEQLARLPRSLVRQSAQVVASATADTTVLYKEALIQRLSAAGHVTVVSVDLLMQVFAGLQMSPRLLVDLRVVEPICRVGGVREYVVGCMVVSH